MAEDDPALTVAAGYDAITEAYIDWAAATSDPARDRWLAQFASRIPIGAALLELGCGSGGPSTAFLAGRFRLTGIDVSAGQLERAHANLPDATFVLADMTEVAFEPGQFSGVVALYSINHVPREQHAALFARIATWLAPGGWFLASLGAEDDPGWTGPWLGVPMFFSGFDAATNIGLLEDAGFRVDAHEIVTLREPPPEGDARFQWVLAQRR